MSDANTSDLPTLDGPTAGPVSAGAPKQLVIMCHGVGSDGQDLIGLAPYFQKILPDALFLSPDGPYPFDMAPFGRQWFSLQESTPESRLEGVKNAAPILNAFIDAKLAETGLGPKDLALVGFSQGTMVALYTALRRPQPIAGVLGYSGMLVGGDTLKDEITAKPPVLLCHGKMDDVVPFDSLGQAEAQLRAVGVHVDTVSRDGLAHGLDDGCVMAGMSFLADIFGVDVRQLAGGQP